MGEILAKATHYMTFPLSTSGFTKGDFTVKITKNGEAFDQIAYEITEPFTNIYTLSFANDGTERSIWTAIVYDPDDSDRGYIETWEVRKNIIEKNVQQIRSRQDSEGGFFKSSTGDSNI